MCTGARVVTAAAGAVLAVAEAARVCTLTDAVGVGAGAWVDGAVVEAATAVDGAVETCTVAVGVGSAATHAKGKGTLRAQPRKRSGSLRPPSAKSSWRAC